MDGYEATRIVFSRIQSLEPGNASRIMGLLLIQDHGDKEMIRLAFGPEALLHSVILKAKKELGLPINSSSSRLLGSNGVNLPFLSIPATNPSSTFTGMVDEFQLQDQLADACGGNTDSIRFPSYWGNTSFQRSNNTMNDILGADDPSSAFWWRPCLYFARGYCKNGNNCRFIHSRVGESAAEGDTIFGSPNKFEMMDQCHELLRSKSARQQRLAAAAAAAGAGQIMGSGSFPYSPKSINLVLQQPQNDAQRAALMMGDDMNKFNRSSPASRQIYLTFPADSTFREEDVSNYFSIYGPVQDVRIPYQQKRMFGFVTFIYPETVKMILAKGNPHFVCDSRVLVKPYKEKGKIPDEKQPQQKIENGTLTGLDSRDPFDVQLGARMFYNNQDILWRRKLGDQTDLQQALELQNRRLMSLQLLDVKKHSPNLYGQSLVLPQENSSSPVPATSVTAAEKQTSTGKETVSSEENGSEKESPHCEDGNLPESLEHNLPDSPFASPGKASKEYLSFNNAVTEKDGTVSANNNWIPSTLLPANNALDMSSFNSFNCQIPRFSSGQGTIGMYTGTGGPTCPVGI
ncbi:hypothetical protein Gogos_000217 [Gossypium gossypioides]|uniref:Zinc finger CCCH domain-containing protein 46-like n=1 Tax=Gossypium gossypioides TaxID=34282 RepID=A0A7J9CS49_GOSGO|nr:hypothetical protein [Gossypium gossypioides]